MRLPIAKFYPAHSSNYTVGRTRPIRKFTVHHSAGWEVTLRHLWGDPARNGSSTFWVGHTLGAVEQYVDTKDMPWTNTNSDSNMESLTCETRGDWRGYYDATTLKNLENLMYECLKIWPHLVMEFHMDVSRSSTLCPADLKHKGHALAAWNRAKARLAPKPAPAPAPKPVPTITYEAIKPKRVQMIRKANLWNFNFSSWSNAKSVNPSEYSSGYPIGYVADVVAEATNPVGAKYYMTAYSFNNGSIRATHGFNINDAKDYVPKLTKPPTPAPTWEAMLTPRKLIAAVDTYVYDLSTMKTVGEVIPKGKDIEFVQKINLDKMYLRSKWAKANGKFWGVPFDQLEEVKDVPREPIPEKPIDVDPDTPGEGDVEIRLNAIEKFLLTIGFKK